MNTAANQQEKLREDDIIAMHNKNVELEKTLSNDIVMLKTLLSTEEGRLEDLTKEAMEKFGVSSVEELRSLYATNLQKNRETVGPAHQALIEIEQIVQSVKKDLNLG